MIVLAKTQMHRISNKTLKKGKFLKYQRVKEFHMMAHNIDAFRNKLQGLKFHFCEVSCKGYQAKYYKQAILRWQ